MATLTESAMASLLDPYLGGVNVPDDLYGRLSVFLDLLLKWNTRMNLTTIHDPEQIVKRHFGESLFLARHLPACASLLDFGSGAGFPGIPVQLFLPRLEVVLAESQGKKAGFLQEAVRVLELTTAVWGQRVEAMPLDRKFHVVTMRAVDKMDAMLPLARARIVDGGWLALLSTGGEGLRLPQSETRVLQLVQC